MIEPLEQPREVTSADGLTVTATHRAWGSTHQRWNKPELVSYSVLGQLTKAGAFVSIAGTEEYAPITGDDYAQLLAANDQGKPDQVFRTSDVLALHHAILARTTDARAARIEADDDARAERERNMERDARERTARELADRKAATKGATARVAKVARKAKPKARRSPRGKK